MKGKYAPQAQRQASLQRGLLAYVSYERTQLELHGILRAHHHPLHRSPRKLLEWRLAG